MKSLIALFDRLVKKAEKITTTNYKIDLVVEQFESVLRPMDREVIQLFPDQCTGTGLNLLRAKAKLLDDRKYHSKVEVTSHQVEIDEVRRALENQVDKLPNQLSALANQISHNQNLISNIENDKKVSPNRFWIGWINKWLLNWLFKVSLLSLRHFSNSFRHKLRRI